MKRWPQPRGTPANLSESVHQQLSMYALAAGAAGLGVALPNQTAPIPPTTILTPKRGTLYRVSFYVDCGGQNLDTVFLLHWTDAIGNQTFSSSPCNSPNNPAVGNVTVRDKAGSPLSYEVTIVQGHYDLFFTVERLE